MQHSTQDNNNVQWCRNIQLDWRMNSIAKIDNEMGDEPNTVAVILVVLMGMLVVVMGMVVVM
eukprot:5974689-Lingulodinium_polyedra.AAC.1